MAYTSPEINEKIKLKIYIKNQLVWTIENGRLIEGDGTWGQAKYDFNSFEIKPVIDGYDDYEINSEGKLLEGARYRLKFNFPYNKGNIKVVQKIKQGFLSDTLADFAEIKVYDKQPTRSEDLDLLRVIGKLLLDKLEESQQEVIMKNAANDNYSIPKAANDNNYTSEDTRRAA
jgi:hypothetical protein